MKVTVPRLITTTKAALKGSQARHLRLHVHQDPLQSGSYGSVAFGHDANIKGAERSVVWLSFSISQYPDFCGGAIIRNFNSSGNMYGIDSEAYDAILHTIFDHLEERLTYQAKRFAKEGITNGIGVTTVLAASRADSQFIRIASQRKTWKVVSKAVNPKTGREVITVAFNPLDAA